MLIGSGTVIYNLHKFEHLLADRLSNKDERDVYRSICFRSLKFHLYEDAYCLLFDHARDTSQLLEYVYRLAFRTI